MPHHLPQDPAPRPRSRLPPRPGGRAPGGSARAPVGCPVLSVTRLARPPPSPRTVTTPCVLGLSSRKATRLQLRSSRPGGGPQRSRARTSFGLTCSRGSAVVSARTPCPRGGPSSTQMPTSPAAWHPGPSEDRVGCPQGASVRRGAPAEAWHTCLLNTRADQPRSTRLDRGVRPGRPWPPCEKPSLVLPTVLRPGVLPTAQL